jgi:cytoskeletal protein CcmA (bactofilin family)
MTMFTRNDKPSEQGVRTAMPVAEKTDTVTPIVAETRRVPETTQPVAHFTPSSTHSQSTSVISKALKITGQLESTENIQIDGEIDGDVRGVSVKVGHNAKVKGSVYGEEVELSGTVEGKIEAKKVVLTSSAHMSGDVIHQDITIQSGAYIAGHLRPEYGKTERQTVLARPKEAIPRI